MNLVKRILRSALIFLGIVFIFPLCYLIYGYLARYSYLILPAGDGQASAITWLDGNANGIRDPGENNLPHVCVWMAYSPEGGASELDPCQNSATDQQGNWGEFLPGGSCTDVFVFARSPDSFQPTTDAVSTGCDARFGFVQDNVPVTHKVLSIDEYVQQHNRQTAFKQIAIVLVISAIGILGTIWLEKSSRDT